jgi:hypothetical protein
MMPRFLYLFVLVLLLACRREEAAPAYPLDSTVLVEIKEVRIADKKHVVLSCQTQKSYPCANFYIKSAFQQAAGKITIEFLGIGSDRLCPAAQGPARIDLDLGPLANGQYPIVLHHQAANAGTLQVSEGAIRLELPQPSGVQVVNPVFVR